MDAKSLAAEASKHEGIAVDTANRLRRTGTPQSLSEAKRVVTQEQRNIRALKQRCTSAEREIQNSYKSAIATVNANNHILLTVATGKKSKAGSVRARQRQDLGKRKDKAIAPYRHAKIEMDRMLANLDGVKAALTTEIERSKAANPTRRASASPTASPAPVKPKPSAPPSTPPPPTLPPSWLADPTGRHQTRYWDGSRWTEHVANNGIQGVDHL